MMVRVLHELFSLDGGGVERLVYDYYRNMDHNKVQFDFVISDLYKKGIFEDYLTEQGCKIFKIVKKTENKKKYLKQIEDIIDKGDYDVIHSHYGIYADEVMQIAKKHNIKKRIIHSHVAYEPITFMQKVKNIIHKRIALSNATDLFACGRDAGVFMWGKRAVESGKVHIMKNAVDTSKFAFSNEKRLEKRKELGVEDKFVIGIVGRLSEPKNYPFLWRVYKKVLEKRNDTALVVVGRGTEEKEIKSLAKKMGIYDKINFLGVRDDVPELLNAMDLFVLPSLYEGLPVVLVENQSNGLMSLASDKITDEMAVTDLVNFLPIEGTEEQWAEEICNYKPTIENRKSYRQQIIDNGYDIKSASLEMQNFYLK
ncbi:glycosyltransferase [Ruminococcus bovis]|uniref:Glycosyltransferase family 1 protein n=1 Tax=Ruminococcus bovis TaxID=2564099 RepID=A0A4P8XWV8_9FIRM|nr:glycosyltransferase [Ruminococcus bovis]QCT06954.1 glycosyltransferase family 1 protein [Ruminococcus bovis]